jgi:hypothetical protein
LFFFHQFVSFCVALGPTRSNKLILVFLCCLSKTELASSALKIVQILNFDPKFDREDQLKTTRHCDQIEALAASFVHSPL